MQQSSGWAKYKKTIFKRERSGKLNDCFVKFVAKNILIWVVVSQILTQNCYILMDGMVNGGLSKVHLVM